MADPEKQPRMASQIGFFLFRNSGLLNLRKGGGGGERVSSSEKVFVIIVIRRRHCRVRAMMSGQGSCRTNAPSHLSLSSQKEGRDREGQRGTHDDNELREMMMILCSP
jgi:hypothetical protein